MKIIIGAELFDLLQWALDSIGLHDIRVRSEKDLVQELKGFIEISAAFDIESNEAALKAYIKMLQKHVSILEESLKQDWNVKLGKEDEPTEVITEKGLWRFCKASGI